MRGFPQLKSTTTETLWRTAILAASAAVIIVTVFCLSHDITTVFMHLYYIPIVLLTYHYRKKGFFFSVLLSLVYVTLVAAFEPNNIVTVEDAGIRAIIFIGIAALVTYLSEHLLQAHETFQESREMYRDLIENIDEVIFSLDLEGNFTYISPVIERLYGYSPENVIGLNFLKFIHPDDQPHCIEGFRQRLNGNYERDEFRILTSDGRVHSVSVSPHPIVNDGEVIGFNYVMTDITGRKTADVSMERSHAILKSVVESPKEVVIFALDSQYRYIAFNENHRHTMKQIWGVDIALGNSMLEYITNPEDHEKAKINFDRAISGDSFTVVEAYGDTALERRWYEDIYNPITDRNGNVIGLTLFLTDITNRKMAEDALRLQNQIFETIAEGVYLIRTSDGIIVYTNPKFEKMFGYETGELYGKHVSVLNAPHDKQSPLNIAEEIMKALHETGEWRGEIKNIRKDGTTFWCLAVVSMFEHPKFGSVWISAHTDITARKRAEEAVQVAVKLNQLIDTMSVSESMEYTLDEAERMTASRIGFFHLINPDEQTIQLVAWSTETRKHCFISKEPERNYPVEKAGVWVDCMRERKPVIHNDYASLPHKKGLPEGHVPVIREIIVPIFDEDKIVAIVGVGNKATDYDGTDINVLTLLASNAWTLIQRKRAEEERERIRSWQAGINRILESVLAPLPLYLKLKIITDGVVETFGADFCRIWLIEKGDLCSTDCMYAKATEGPHMCRFRDKCLHLKASSGRYIHIDGKGHRRVPFGAYKIGRIASGEETKFLTNDVVHDPRVHDHEWAKSLGLVAFSGYRLKPPDGEVLGVFALFARFPISPDMDAILDGLSRSISLAVQKDIAEEDLRESEKRYRDMFELNNAVMLTINPENGRIMDANSSACRYYGYSKEEITARVITDINIADPAVIKENMTRAAGEPGAVFNFRHRKKNGEIRDVEVFSAPIMLGGRRLLHSIIQDVTERKRVEAALIESEQRFRDIFNNTSDVILLHEVGDNGAPGRFTDVNDVTCRMLGYTREELFTKTPLDITTDFHNPSVEKILEEQRITGSARFETEYRAKDGTIIPVEVNTRVVTIQGKKLMLGTARDITERKNAEALLKRFNEELEQQVKIRTEELNATLNEKVLLLREIHHRVKNNLQIIISLVNLQMRQIDDERLKKVMAETQNRVRAMALVHEKLYQSEDISRIDLASYARFLVTHLFAFYGVNSRQVVLNIDIGKITIDINTAIPLGLIINELASNALKYAFPDGRTGEITITVTRDGLALHIQFRDNGIGIPETLDWKNTQSLGLRLVNTLVDQLNGTVELDRHAGTFFSMVLYEKAFMKTGQLPEPIV
jgi:PAS domain S-box-containing protein